MELHLGLMRTRELSEWFGIKEDTYRHTKEKRLKILTNFAKYHMQGKQVYIDEIYVPEYSKALHVIEKNFLNTWDKSGIDTCTNVANKMYNNHIELSSQIKKDTAHKYTNQTKIHLYGHNNRKDFGKLGYSEFVQVDPSTNKELSEEQAEKAKECRRKAYSQYNDQASQYHILYDSGKITDEDYKALLDDLVPTRTNCLSEYYKLVEKELGFIPEYKTKLNDTLNFEGAEIGD